MIDACETQDQYINDQLMNLIPEDRSGVEEPYNLHEYATTANRS